MTLLRHLLSVMPLLPVTLCVLVGNAAALCLDDAGMVVAMAVWGVGMATVFCLRIGQGVLYGTAAMLACYISVQAQAARLPEGLTREPIQLVGHIVSRTVGLERVHHLMQVEQCAPVQADRPACHRLRMVNLGAPLMSQMLPGERWQVIARLRPPHGMANPGQLDSVYGQYRQGIDGVGDIRRISDAQQLAAAPVSLRYPLQARIEHSQLSETGKRWLAGLLLGESRAFTDADWQLLNDTGTTHLVVVSGMHVGLVAGAVYFLSSRVAGVCFPRRHRVMVWPRFMAVLSGCGYALLAHGGAPAVRACVMMLPVLLAFNGRIKISAWHGWWCALLVVLMAHPYALVTPGIALSFGAVATLMLMWKGHAPSSKLYAFLRTQLWITLMLDGVLLCFFGRFAPLSFPANVIAIPWVTMVLMPLALCGGLLDGGVDHYGWVWQGFDVALSLLTALLRWGTHYAPSWVMPSWQARGLGIGMILVACLNIFPGMGWRFRAVGSVMLLPLLKGWPAPQDELMPGEVIVRVHDVGQGQLIDIRTQQHRMLYDTGPQSHSGTRAIDRLWPARQSFDNVVVSHGDLDHAGGIPSLLAQHDVRHWYVPYHLPLMASGHSPINESICRSGDTWHADGVTFRFLWPLRDEPLPSNENDRSCVLLIESTYGRILLTGDGGHAVEQRLLRQFEQPIAAWVAGHHGSQSSSARALVMRARPREVVYSAGYANSYHHPAESVVHRFQAIESRQWNTATDGAVTLTLNAYGLHASAHRR